MNRDPLASVRAARIEVDLAGWTYVIEPAMADAWIEVVLAGDLGAIFPGMLNDRDLERDVWQQVLAGQVGKDDLEKAAYDVLGQAGGRPWWEVRRLVLAATSERTSSVVLGGLIRAGFDFSARPFGAFLDAVYSLAVDGCTEDQRLKLDMELKTAPAGVQGEDLYDEEEAAREFLEMNSLGNA